MTSESQRLLRRRLNNLLFSCNLQEFSRQIEELCSLLANQQISEREARQRIESLWQEFENSIQQLGVKSSNEERPRGNGETFS
jgi:uncharacterized coiled-coil protein SlyX